MKQNTSINPRLEAWLAVILIVFSAAITYGIFIPKLGFYRDDWYMLWAGQSPEGIGAIIRLFQTDRPLIGFTFALIFKFIGPRVLIWQTLGLVLKIGTGLSALWLLRLAWPEKRLETTTAALLFVLYPGFYQQPVAGTFSIDLLGLNAIFLSIALTLFAIKSSNRLLQVLATLVSIALGLINLGLYEATIGLEVVRWVLIWLVLIRGKASLRSAVGENADETTQSPEDYSREQRKSKFLLGWRLTATLIPYFLMLGGFLYWRLFMFKSVRRATNLDLILADYTSNPLFSAIQVAINYLKDLLETVVMAWFVPFYQFTAEGQNKSFLTALAIALVVLVLAAIYLRAVSRDEQVIPATAGAALKEDPSLMITGLVAVLVPSAVIVLLGRNVLFAIQWDRYTTQSMLGVGMLVSGMIFYALRARARWVVLATLIVLAVMTHYHSAAAYARFWDYERNVIWQLSWRAPGLKPGTTVIVSLPEGTRLAEEYEIWGPVNMAYFPGQEMQVSGQVPTDSLILDLQAKTRDKRLMRNVNIVRDYSKPLIVSLPSGSSCVHVLDGNLLALPFFENGRIKEIGAYSNIELIDTAVKPVTPSPDIFSQEPDHGWCYYYQKIDLALQAGNFAMAAHLADEAEQKDLQPTDDTEWVPVIEAYNGAGDTHKAAATLEKMDKSVRKYICTQQPSGSGTAHTIGFLPTLCGGN